MSGSQFPRALSVAFVMSDVIHSLCRLCTTRKTTRHFTSREWTTKEEVSTLVAFGGNLPWKLNASVRACTLCWPWLRFSENGLEIKSWNDARRFRLTVDPSLQQRARFASRRYAVTRRKRKKSSPLFCGHLFHCEENPEMSKRYELEAPTCKTYFRVKHRNR